MGDALKKVQPGDAIEFPAATFNAFVDAAKYVQAHRHDQGRDSGFPLADADVVLVKNSSGSDADRFGVLVLTGVLFTPTDNADGFKNQPVFTGGAPGADRAGPFVVLAEPIANGKIGRAWASGVCVAYLDVNDADDAYADTASGEMEKLATYADAGGAEILWKESGTGDKWGLVRFGAFASGVFGTTDSIGVSGWVDVDGEGTKTVTLDSNDWRSRVITHDIGWDSEPMLLDAFGNTESGVQVPLTATSNEVNIFSKMVGNDSVRMYVDGGADGILKLEIGKGNPQSYMHLFYWVMASAYHPDPTT